MITRIKINTIFVIHFLCAIIVCLPLTAQNHMSFEEQRLHALVADSLATHRTALSGNWSDSTTWVGGVLPPAGARVVIESNHTVVVDSVRTESLMTVRVDGTLSFSNTLDSELFVDTIVVTESGTLEIGTAAQPVTAGVMARLTIADYLNAGMNQTDAGASDYDPVHANSRAPESHDSAVRKHSDYSRPQSQLHHSASNSTPPNMP